jgi:DNA-binding SARP family transcriptional activator
MSRQLHRGPPGAAPATPAGSAPTAGVELGILGPLLVRVGGTDVDIGPGLPRTLLTRLLVEVNRVVTPARLMADLSPATAPAASSVLRAAVSHLRRTLGAERLVTVPEGHLLVVKPGELDVARFSALVAQSRLPTSEPADVADLLTEAESLWRGPALGASAERPWARATVARLEMLRRDVTLTRLDALVACGRAQAVADEAESLLARWPADQELRQVLTHARRLSRGPGHGHRAPSTQARSTQARSGHRSTRRPHQPRNDPLGRPPLVR